MTTEIEPPAGGAHSSRVRDPWLWLGVGVVLLAAVGITVGVILSRGGPSLSAAKLPPLPAIQGDPRLLRAVAGSVSGTTVSLTTASGSRTATVGPATRVEALLPATPDDVAVGDYLTVGGVPNLVYSSAVKLVAIIPAEEADPSASGPPRSKAGFTGWETYADPSQQPEVYGRVESIDAGGIHLSGPLGVITVKLDESGPLRRLTSGGVELIHGGDHLALAAASAASPTAILVLPGR